MRSSQLLQVDYDFTFNMHRDNVYLKILSIIR